MSCAIKAGVLYFAGAFALGFLFGGIRLILLEPALGPSLAVLVEVPVMLLLCWVLCARAVRLLQVPAVLADRLVMGVTAYVLLMLADLTLFFLMFGNSLTEYLAGLQRLDGLIGLLGQLLFAAFPLLQGLNKELNQ